MWTQNTGRAVWSMWRRVDDMNIVGQIKVDMAPVSAVMKRLGVTARGDVQAFTTNMVNHRITRYMPFRSGVLSTKMKFIKSPTEIEVVGPYAHFQYEGKVWIYPPTGSTWAPKYGMKEKTDRPLDQKTGTKNDRAGPFWDRRLMAAEGAAMRQELQDYVDRRAGR